MYHITMRVNHQQMQLRPIAVKELYIKVVEDAKLKYKFRIETFCIMDNHVHFIIQPDIDESISRIMQWINGVFAMRYNRLMSIGGSFWGERFYSRILQRLKDYLRTLEYIEENPVRANLVYCAVDWLFGGARHRADGCESILDFSG
ncbi:MAG: hypothetical protein A2Z96_07845 [Spirochaetes bacterium GWB1_48_6]|nr:MAG: hypothetical protein A2Z96_07845 [Spirochaetes bacterium GWB1_48_6]